MLDEANEYYHSLLSQENTESFRKFFALLFDDSLRFGDRALCPFLRPKFLLNHQYQNIQKICATLRGAFVKTQEAILEDPEVFHAIGLSEEEKELANISPGYQSIDVIARLDAFLTKHSLYFVELNAESPAGILYSDTLQRHFLDFAPMKRFQKQYRVQGLYGGVLLLKNLLETYLEWGGQKSPTIAIVDWKEVPTRHEFSLLQKYFTAHGISTCIADPRDLDFVSGKLYARGKAIDLVYRRILSEDIFERPLENKALLDAYQTGAVCVVNSFRSLLIQKKSLFALLHSPKIQQRFLKEELSVVKKHIPWTAYVQEGFTQGPLNDTIDLIPWLQENREQLVLKPNDSYGGQGVTVGHLVDQSEWENAMKNAIAFPFIVQTRVQIPSESFPVYTEKNGLEFCKRYVDLDPFLFRGECGSILTRLSETSLCNVSTGGGSVPTLILEPQEGNP